MKRLFWPVLFWTLGLLMAFHPTVLSGLALMQTDPGDTRLNHYILEHGLRWLLRVPGHTEFWNPPIFFPRTNTGAYTDILIGAAPFYAFWRMSGFLPDTAFQLWMITVVSLNFWAAYLWLHRGLRPLATLNALPAATGAFIFAYASSRVAQFGHQQLLPHFYSILALYSVTRIFVLQGPKARIWIIVLFASLVLQLYAGFYLGWFILVGLGVATFWALVLPAPRRRLSELLQAQWPVVLGCGIASLALLAPMLTHYLEAGKEVGHPPFDHDTVRMLPRLQSWVYLGPGSWLYAWQDRFALFRDLPMNHEHRIGVGLLTTVVAIAGLVAERRRTWVLLLGVCAMTVFLLASVFPGEFGLWRHVHTWIPAGRAIRALSRIGLLMLIPVAVGIALFLQRRKAAWVAVPVALLCALEQGQTTPAFDKAKSRAQIQFLASRIRPDCQAFYFSPVLAPGQTTPEWKFQVDAMWAQMLSGVPTVNGYSGRFPPGWGLFDNRIGGPADERRIRNALMDWSKREGLDASSICWVRAALGD